MRVKLIGGHLDGKVVDIIEPSRTILFYKVDPQKATDEPWGLDEPMQTKMIEYHRVRYEDGTIAYAIN